MYELTIRMLVEEMCEWWSNNWGWCYPLQSTIESIKNDRIFLVSLLKIKKRCMEENGLGFIDFINSFTGIPQNQREKYFRKKFGNTY